MNFSTDVGATSCTYGDIRLFRNTTTEQGRLEICVNNIWGRVCSGGWYTPDADNWDYSIQVCSIILG